MVEEKKEKIIYVTTYGAEDPERASLPFVLANAALVMEVEAVVALQGASVFLAKKRDAGTCSLGRICAVERPGGVISGTGRPAPGVRALH